MEEEIRIRVMDTNNGEVNVVDVEDEARKIVFTVIRDTFCNQSFSYETTLEDYTDELHDNITYTVLRDYSEGRYRSITDAFFMISRCARCLYELIKIND